MSDSDNNGNRNANGPIRTHESVSGPTRTEGGTPPTPPVPSRNISSVDSNAMRAARAEAGRVIEPVQVIMTHRAIHGPTSTAGNTPTTTISRTIETSTDSDEILRIIGWCQVTYEKLILVVMAR